MGVGLALPGRGPQLTRPAPARICPTHLKADEVLLEGKPHRFCQKCVPSQHADLDCGLALIETLLTRTNTPQVFTLPGGIFV